MAEVHPFLNYGDLVVLWCEGTTELQVEGDAGFLCRRGNLDGGIVINQAQFTEAPRSGIRECVFRLCRPFAYAAKQEYEDYLMRLEGTDTSSFTADELAKFDEKQAILLEKMAKEQAVNVAESKKYFGEPVKFGDTIQLQHWISGDFIDVAGGTIADLEPSAIKLVLTEAGSQCSHMTISPMHKIRRVGHPVALDDDVVFRIHGTEHEHYIHATFSVSSPHSSSSGTAGGKKSAASNTSITASTLVPAGEGNCYFEPSAFRVRRFDTSWERSDSVSVGTVIQLVHPDSDTCLRVFPTAAVVSPPPPPMHSAGSRTSKTKHKRSSEEGKVRSVVKDPPTPKQAKKNSKHGGSKSSSKKKSAPKKATRGEGSSRTSSSSEADSNLSPSQEGGGGGGGDDDDARGRAEPDTPPAYNSGDLVRSCEVDTPSVPPVSSLWILESETAVVGGIVDWNLRFRLKNFETHNYLRYVCDAVPQLQGRKPVCPDRLTTCDQPLVGTVFGFRPASSGQSVTVDVDFGVQLVPLEFLGDDPNLSKSEKARLRSLIGITLLPGDPDPAEAQQGTTPRTSSSNKSNKKRRNSKDHKRSRNNGGDFSSSAGSSSAVVTRAEPDDDSLQLFVTTKTEMTDAFLVRPLSLKELRPYDTCLELLARLDKHAAVILEGLAKVVHSTAGEQSREARTASASQTSQIVRALDGLGRALVWLHVFQYGDGGQSLKDNNIDVQNTESVLTIADDPRFTWPSNALSARRQLILCDMGHEVIMKRQQQLIALMQAVRRHRSRDPTTIRRAADFAEQLRRLCNLNYSLVTVMCQGGNTHCRNILQQHVSTMATHALDEVGAYDAMKEILRDNVRMLIKNPDLESQIRVLAWNLRDFGFVPDCLEFLEVLCICNDVAITDNQTSIVHHVVERGAPYLVRFHLNTEQQDHRAPKLDANPDYPCYPGQSIGPDLLERKHPILIGWLTNENAATRDEPGFISMRELFPKNKILHKKIKGMGERKSSALLTGAINADQSEQQEVATPTEWVTLTYFVEQVVEAARLANDHSENGVEGEPATAGGGGDDGAKNRLPRHEQVLTMYSFALTQLRLLSKCCEERNYLGIKMLQGEFTVELLLTGLHDPRIPCELRECFAHLLNTIHVDVAPFRSVNVPSRTYIVYDQSDNDGHQIVQANNKGASVGAPGPGVATDALAVPEPYKFSVVQLVLLSIFSDLDEADNDTLFTFIPQVKGTGDEQNQQRLNSFTESILMLVKQLITFGFFSATQTPGLLEIVLEQLEKFSLTEPRLNTKKLSSRSRSFQQLDLQQPTKTRRGGGGQEQHASSKIHPMTVVQVEAMDESKSDGSGGEETDEVSMANEKVDSGRVHARLGPLLLSCIGFLAGVAMVIYAFYFRNHENHINEEAFLDAPVYNSQLIALVILFADYSRVVMFWNSDKFFGWRGGIKLSLMVFLLLDLFHYIFFSMIPEGVIFYRFLRLVVYVMLIAFYALDGRDKTADSGHSDDNKKFRAVEFSNNGPAGRQDDGKRVEKMHLLEVLEAVMRFRQQESVSEIVHGICNGHELSEAGVLINNKIGILDDRCSRIVNSTLAKCNRDPCAPRVLGVCQGFLQWADPDVVAGAVKAMDSLLTSAQFVLRCVNNCTVLTKADEILVFKKLRDDFWGLCDLVEQFELFVGRQVAPARTELFFNKVHARITSIMYAESLVGIEDLDSEYLFDELNKIHIGMGQASASLRALVGRLYDLFSCIVAASPTVSARFFHQACEEEFVRIIGYSPGATQLLLEVVEGNSLQNELLPNKVILSCARALDYSVKQVARYQKDTRLTTFDDAEDNLIKSRTSGLGQFEGWKGLELAREQLAVMHIFMLLQINDDVTGARQLQILRALCQTRTTELRRVVHRLHSPVNITTSLVDEDHQKHYHRLATLKRGPLTSRIPKDRGVWAAHVECSLQTRLLYTLAFSCSGSSTLIQSKIESIMHFQRAVSWILSTQTHWNLKAACFVFLRYTARENLLGVDYTNILEALMGVVSTLLKYANEACQASHTFDVLRSLRHEKQLRDDFMEHEPPISNSDLFIGDDYENVLVFRIAALHALPLLTSVCTSMTARHKSELRVRLRDVQGKVARLVDWSQRNGYDYATKQPVIGTAGASVSGVSDFELFACRTRELHDVLTARLGVTSTTSVILQEPAVGRSLSLSSSTKSNNGPGNRRRSSFPRQSISNMHSRRQSMKRTEIDSGTMRDTLIRRQQEAQVAVASGDNAFKMYKSMHQLARTRPTDFGVVIRNVMSILRQCAAGSGNSLASPEVRVSNIKRWSAEHNDSLTAGGTRTPRQVVALLLRSLVFPAKDLAFINAESFEDLVGRRATLDAQDEASEEMRLQLLYVGALETSLQLYGLFTDDPLGLASLKLAVMLMSRTPSPRSKHQDIMLRFLQSDASTGFLTRVESFLNEYTQRVRNHWLLAMFAGGVTTAATEEMKFVLQLLRLSCLSKHSGNQSVLRTRVGRDGTSFNILSSMVNLFAALAQSCDLTTADPARCEKELKMAIVVAVTLEDMVVGPCLQNQRVLAFNTPLLHVVNQVFRTRVYFDDYGDVIRRFPESASVSMADNNRMVGLIRDLQTSCISLVTAVLEGRPDVDVHQRVCETLELHFLLQPLARTHAIILRRETSNDRTPPIAAQGGYSRTHSSELEFGCSLMDLLLRLKAADPEWWRKHLDDPALERNLAAGTYSPEEVAAFRYFGSMLLHVDVLWKIYDVGGGAGESIALPVARPHMTMSEQLVFNEELAKYVASQTPRYLRQRFYFMKPTIAFFTGTSAVEKYLQDKLVRDSRETKLRSLLDESAFLYTRLKIQRVVFEASQGMRLFSTNMMKIMESIAFWTGVSINFLLIVSLEHSSGVGGINSMVTADVHQTYNMKLAPFFAASTEGLTENIIATMLDFLIIISMVAYGLAVVLRIVNVSLPYGMRRPHGSTDAESGSPGASATSDGSSGGDDDTTSDNSSAQRGGSPRAPMALELALSTGDSSDEEDAAMQKARVCWHAIYNSVTLTPTKENASIVLYLALMCCGIAYIIGRGDNGNMSPVLMSLTLLQFFLRNSYIGLVLEAVTSTLQQLAYTLIGMVIVMYIFAVVAFNYFATDFEDGQCLEMWSCLLEVLNFGMRNGGGIGDTLRVYNSYTQTFLWVGHSFFDWLFFIIINVIFLNVVFGIIVDQFAELRDQRKERDNDLANCCPICGTDVSDDSEGDHLKEHSLANYVYFLIHLDDESTVFNRVGVESYVCDALANDFTAIDWFPRGNGSDHSSGDGDGGGRDDDGNDQDNHVSKHLPFATQDSRNDDDFDLEETLERQEHTIDTLRNTVELLREQNESVKTSLSELQQSMRRLLEAQQSAASTAAETK